MMLRSGFEGLRLRPLTALLGLAVATLPVSAIPALAGDGSYIVLAQDESGRYLPWGYDGGGLAELADIDSITSPELSPDGETVVFSGAVGDESLGEYALFTMSVDGSGLNQWTSDTESALDPSWSPSGARIVFSMNDTGSLDPATCCRLAILELASGNVTQLSGTTGAIRPHYAPSGSFIVYDTPTGVYRVPSSGGSPSLLAAGGRDAAVSETGNTVAYLATSGSTTSILRVPSGGGAPTTIYTTSRQVENPFWRDGRLFFTEYTGLGYEGRKDVELRSIASKGGGIRIHEAFDGAVVGVSPGGDNDELFFYRDTGAFGYFEVSSDGTDLSPVNAAGSGYTTDWSSITSVDLEGNGEDEAFFYRDDGLFRYYQIRPDGSLPSPMLAGKGYTTGWTSITSVDLDGDGQDEMFFYRTDGLFRYYQIRPDGSLPSPILAGSGYTSGWTSITSVDLDGDGQDEMFFYRSDGLYRFYDIASTGAIGQPLTAGDDFPVGWTAIIAVDLDGDGDDEMLFYRDDGTYEYRSVSSSGVLGSVIASGSDYGLNWDIASAIDLTLS